MPTFSVRQIQPDEGPPVLLEYDTREQAVAHAAGCILRAVGVPLAESGPTPLVAEFEPRDHSGRRWRVEVIE